MRQTRSSYQNQRVRLETRSQFTQEESVLKSVSEVQPKTDHALSTSMSQCGGLWILIGDRKHTFRENVFPFILMLKDETGLSEKAHGLNPESNCAIATFLSN